MSVPHIDAPPAVTGTALTRIRRDSATEDPRESLLRTSTGALSLTTTDADQTVEAVLAHKREANPRDLFLAIPRACVGGVIGRGGQLLRDMQAEFNVKVYVEKEEYSGQRIVRLTYLGSHASTNSNNSSSGAAAASGRKGTVKRSAAGSDEDDEEADRHGHDAHKRNRRDESTNREEELEVQGGKDHKDMDNKEKDRDGTTLSSGRPSNGPAPKRKGTSEGGDGLDGDEGGNVSKKVRDSSSNNSSSTGGGGDREAVGDEVEDGGDEAESRLKRKRGEASEPANHTPSNSSSSSIGAGGADLSDAGLPMRKLVLCKERIEARVEELQKQIADSAGI